MRWVAPTLTTWVWPGSSTVGGLVPWSSPRPEMVRQISWRWACFCRLMRAPGLTTMHLRVASGVRYQSTHRPHGRSSTTSDSNSPIARRALRRISDTAWATGSGYFDALALGRPSARHPQRGWGGPGRAGLDAAVRRSAAVRDGPRG